MKLYIPIFFLSLGGSGGVVREVEIFKIIWYYNSKLYLVF